MIAANRSITKLNIRGSLIRNDELSALTRALVANTTITELILSDILARQEPIQAFCAAMKTHPSLAHLTFAGNHIGEAATELSDMIRKNKVLRTVNIDGSKELTRVGKKILLFSLAANTPLLSFSMCDVYMEAELGPEVVKVLKANTRLEEFHLRKSGLFGKHCPPELIESLLTLFVGSASLLVLDADLPDPAGRLATKSMENRQLTEVPPALLKMTNLQSLNLSNNFFTSLPEEISLLTELRELDISNNRLLTLPPPLGFLTNLKTLRLANNAFKTPPPEVLSKNNVKLILGYLRDLAKGAEPVYRIKLMMVGQENVGKTTILRHIKRRRLRRAMKKGPIKPTISTDGIDIDEWLLEVPLDDDKDVIMTSGVLTGGMGGNAGGSTSSSSESRASYVPGDNSRGGGVERISATALMAQQQAQAAAAQAQAQAAAAAASHASASGSNANNSSLSGNSSSNSMPLSSSNTMLGGGTNSASGSPAISSNPLSGNNSNSISSGTSTPEQRLSVGGAQGHNNSSGTNLSVPGASTSTNSAGHSTGTLRTMARASAGGGSLAAASNYNPRMSTDQEANKKYVTVSSWDFAGQEIYYTTHQFFLSQRALYVLVWDLRYDEEECKVSYWLQSIRSRTNNSPVIIVGTHADEVSSPEEATAKAERVRKKYQKRFPFIKYSVAVSAKTGSDIDALVQKIRDVIRVQDHTGELIPKTYIEMERLIKSECQAVKEGRAPYPPLRSWSEMQVLGSYCYISDDEELRRCVHLLHDFGSLIYFDDPSLGVQDLVIIDSQFLTNVMATIITTKTSIKDGMLPHSLIPMIWRPPEFPPEIHDILLSLLKKFEIAYTLPAALKAKFSLSGGLSGSGRPSGGISRNNLSIGASSAPINASANGNTNNFSSTGGSSLPHAFLPPAASLSIPLMGESMNQQLSSTRSSLSDAPSAGSTPVASPRTSLALPTTPLLSPNVHQFPGNANAYASGAANAGPSPASSLPSASPLLLPATPLTAPQLGNNGLGAQSSPQNGGNALSGSNLPAPASLSVALPPTPTLQFSGLVSPANSTNSLMLSSSISSGNNSLESSSTSIPSSPHLTPASNSSSGSGYVLPPPAQLLAKPSSLNLPTTQNSSGLLMPNAHPLNLSPAQSSSTTTSASSNANNLGNQGSQGSTTSNQSQGSSSSSSNQPHSQTIPIIMNEDAQLETLIPSLLPEDRPDCDLVWRPSDASKTQYDRRYQLEFVPKGLFSRLLIRIMHHVDSVLVYWRNGIIAEKGKDIFFVELRSHEAVLVVSARGPKSAPPVETFRMCVETIDMLIGLNNWFNIRVNKFVPCPHCIEQGNPESKVWMFKLADLEEKAVSGSWTVECEAPNSERRQMHLTRLVPDMALSDLEKSKIPYDQLTMHEQIGKGAFGEIFRATYRGRDVAVKIMVGASQEGARQKAFNEFRREVHVMSGMRHPNLVNMVGFCVNPFALVMELLPAGNLHKFLHQKNAKSEDLSAAGLQNSANRAGTSSSSSSSTPTSPTASRNALGTENLISLALEDENAQEGEGAERQSPTKLEVKKDNDGSSDSSSLPDIGWPLRLKIALDIALGMNYLHSATPPFIHRDLKSPNILLLSTDFRSEQCAKVGDFGLSSRMYVPSYQEKSITRDVGNPTWLAPEIIREEEFDVSSDVYSYGIILGELLVRKHPYSEYQTQFMFELEDLIKRGKRPSIPKETPSEYASLISRCVADNPAERPTFHDAIKIIVSMAADLAPELRIPQDIFSKLRQVSQFRTEDAGSNSSNSFNSFSNNFDGANNSSGAFLGGGSEMISQSSSFTDPSDKPFGFDDDNNYTNGFASGANGGDSFESGGDGSNSQLNFGGSGLQGAYGSSTSSSSGIDRTTSSSSLVSASSGGTSALTGQFLKQLTTNPMQKIYSMCLVGDDQMWCGTREGSILIWNTRNGNLLAKHEKLHTSAITSLFVAGNYIWSHAWGEKAKVWKTLDEAALQQAMQKRETSLEGWLTHKTGGLTRKLKRRFCTLVSKRLYVYKAEGDKVPAVMVELEGAKVFVDSKAKTPTFTVQPKSTRDKAVIIQTKDRQELLDWVAAVEAEINRHEIRFDISLVTEVDCVDMRCFIVIDGVVWGGSRELRLKVWDPDRFQLLKNVELDISSQLQNIASSTPNLNSEDYASITNPSLLFISCITEQENNKLWIGVQKYLVCVDKESLLPIRVLSNHTQCINAVLGFDGRVWTASDDATIKCWDAHSYDCLQTFSEVGGKQFALVRNGVQIWAAGWDGIIRVFNGKTGQLQRALDAKHQDSVSSFASSYGSMWAASWDGSITIWG